MYVQLLNSALTEFPLTSSDMTPRDALTELLRLRVLHAGAPAQTGSFWAPDAVASELAYDIALIRLAETLGISYEVRDFDRPAEGRARLELAVTSRGIRLDDPDPRDHSRPVASGSSASGA